MCTHNAHLPIIKKQKTQKAVGIRMKALFRIFAVLSATAFAIGLGLDL